MVNALRRRNFALLWVAGLISQMGDWVLFIALPFYIYKLTGSTLATGTMFIAETLPSLLFGTVAGVYVDRWDRRRTMICADFGRSLILLLILTAHGRNGVWLIYLAAFAESTLSQFFNPAKGALLPHLVPEEELMTANSANAFSDNLSRLVGPTVGGALMAWLGLRGVVLIDTLSYILSGMLILCIALPLKTPVNASEERQIEESEAPSAGRRLITEWQAGMQLVKGNRLISGLFMITGLWTFGQGIINALLVVFITRILHGDARLFGWIASAQGIGGLIGGLLIGYTNRKLPPLRLIAWCGPAIGVLFLLLVNFPSQLLALLLIGLIGIPAMGCMIGTQTLLQSGVADLYRGRVLAAYGTLNALLLLIGMGVASVLGDPVGVVPLMDVVGVLYLLSGVVVQKIGKKEEEKGGKREEGREKRETPSESEH